MKQKLENKIMNDIQKGKVKIKSKYIFWAEKLGLGSGIVLSVLLAILMFNLILFYMRETDNLIYLTFGPNGFLAFLESFPYWFVIIFILFIFLIGFLIKKTDFSYKKSFGKIALLTISSILIIGTVLTFTNLNDRFESYLMDHRPPLKNGIAGVIVEKDESGLFLNTRQGVKYIKTQNNDFKVGDFIVAVGKKDKPDFVFENIKKPEMPFMSNHLNQRPPRLDKECMDDCLKTENPNFCIEKCK